MKAYRFTSQYGDVLIDKEFDIITLFGDGKDETYKYEFAIGKKDMSITPAK